MPLTKHQLDRWVKALRDNPTLQGMNELRTKDNKFCCMGMLCEVEGLPSAFDNESGSFRYIFGSGQTSVTLLKGELLDRFGSELGYFEDLGMPMLRWDHVYYRSLAAANDSGVPWAAIADHLEKHYPYEGKPE